MERKRLLAWLAGVAAVVLLAVAALTVATATDPVPMQAARHLRQSPPPGATVALPGLDSAEALPHLAQQLDLSAEQRQAIIEIVAQARPELRRLRAEARAGAERLARTRPDDASYLTLVSNTSEAASELAAERVLQDSRVRSQVFGVLTTEQKARLIELQNRTLDDRAAARRVRARTLLDDGSSLAASGAG